MRMLLSAVALLTLTGAALAHDPKVMRCGEASTFDFRMTFIWHDEVPSLVGVIGGGARAETILAAEMTPAYTRIAALVGDDMVPVVLAFTALTSQVTIYRDGTAYTVDCTRLGPDEWNRGIWEHPTLEGED